MKKSGAERLKESRNRKKEKVRERVQQFRECQREEVCKEIRNYSENEASAFSSLTTRKQAVDKVKEVLPVTPEKKVEVVRILVESPTTREALVNKGVVASSELSKKAELHDAIVEDARSVLSSLKEKRIDDTRAAVQMGLSLLCGETVKNNNLHSTLSKNLSINRRRLAMCTSHQMKVLCDESVGWTSVQQQKRNDAISDEHCKLACDFWASPGISRPTGNKRDIIRERIGPKNYHEHEKQILEKTQNEIYEEFKKKYPEVQMGQRTFESCKPFFVVPARPADRNSCCCRTHVEIRMLFTECMNFRKTVLKQKPYNNVDYPVYDHLNDLVNATLCQQLDGETYYAKECCNRECEKCGVHLAKLLDKEKSMDEEVKVKWQ